MPRGRQSAEPLWRAIAVFRFAGLGYAALLTVINRADFLLRSGAITVVLNGVGQRTAALRGTGPGLLVEDEPGLASIEVWLGDTLAGGAIGIGISGVISGDSLFGRHQGPGSPGSLGSPGGGEQATPRARLRDVYWIGGGSGAGKSTIARRLAARHGLRLYATDEVMADHGRRSSPVDSPLMAGFAAMDMDERWVSRSPETMLETFGWFRGEGFGLIVEDLLGRPAGPGVIAEGFRLLPRLVRPLLAGPGRAVWLCPTPGFRRAAFDSRGSLLQIAGKTSDPAKALANLLERDRMFTERLREEATGLGLPVIDVDTTMTENDLTRRVTRAFGLG